MSLRRKKKNRHNVPNAVARTEELPSDIVTAPLSESLNQVRIRNDSPSSRRSVDSDHSSTTLSTSRKSHRKKCDDIEMGIKNVEMINESTSLQTVEVIKRPGQTLGFYIREGDDQSNKKGVFISRIADGSIVQRNGLLKVGDEIQAINSVNITRTNLDDVVVLMSIPKKLILTIKSHHLSPRLPSNNELKPVYIHKQHSDDTSEYVRRHQLMSDLNTEDSNDSGLSSEHSLKGDRLNDSQSHYGNIQAQGPPNPPVPEPVYARPKPVKSELYVSDGEHEYQCPPRMAHVRNSSTRKDCSRLTKHQSVNNSDSYNSDSELLPKYHSAVPAAEQPANWRNVHSNKYKTQSNVEYSYATLKPPVFPSEMQNWLRKYDTISGEFHPKVEQPENISATQELDGYRNELWRQEKLLNDAIHNMESALNVDAMLQQSTHPCMSQTDSLQSNAVSGGSNALSGGSNAVSGGSNVTGAHTPSAASAYSYLRDLPLLIRSPMKVKIEDFNLYRPDYERLIPTEVMSCGSMKVKIYCGHGLKSSQTSLRDLYCVVQLDNVKQAKTMIRTGAINFDWDETFDMLVQDGTGNLVCMIYLWDPYIRHRLCFTGTIRLANVLNKGSFESQNYKCALKLEPRGILYLEVSFCRDLPDTSESARETFSVFGRPLKEVLTLQGTETSVPLLVRKCVCEIESRGMGVSGIYRLCGAAKKKHQLRQEFDCHPQLVDLSPSNVPEIHAITGLLKDYLRKLPDSLLTTKSYDVVERALTKDTTQDADSDSLEVVNEFVAKLQPWQQGTVVYMLNHLKKVALYHNDNKMTTSNLAICFAPIFVPPQDPEQEGKEEANSMRLHIAIIKYILDIWPQEYSTNNNVVV